MFRNFAVLMVFASDAPRPMTNRSSLSLCKNDFVLETASVRSWGASGTATLIAKVGDRRRAVDPVVRCCGKGHRARTLGMEMARKVENKMDFLAMMTVVVKREGSETCRSI